MRGIWKGAEPGSLVEHRLSGGDYESYREKDDLRKALVRDQRGLCAYCLSRISSASGAMKIEHWRCQSRYSNLQLNYYNLLGTCHGLGPSGVAHCDTSKGDRDISRNPAEAPDQINGMMRFQVSGRVECDDIVFGTEIDQVLNLNARHLINARRGVLDLFKLNLGKKTASRNKLEKLLTIWDGTGNTSDLRPFCQVVVYWLRNASNASKPLHS